MTTTRRRVLPRGQRLDGRSGLGPRRLLVFVLLSVALVVASRTDAVRELHDAARGRLAPVVGAIGDVGDGVRRTLQGAIDAGRLERENAELRLDLAEAEQRAVALEQAARENAELRDLLGVTAALDMMVVPARVVAREPSNAAWELTLGTGSEAGVRPGMPVLAGSDGTGVLVATITAAGDGWATARLVVDERSVVAARVSGSGAIGDLTGHAGGGLVLRNVAITEEVAPGDTVVTAGLRVEDDASRYPGGLLVGRVEVVEIDANAVTKTAYVVPAVDASSLNRLLIVLEFDQG